MNLSLNRIKSQNQMTNIYIGSALLILSILDVFLNSFFRINISGSLPGNLSFFFPSNSWFFRFVLFKNRIQWI